MAEYSATFKHNGVPHFIYFRSTYDGRAYYDVTPRGGESMQIVVTRRGRRPHVAPAHYPNDAERVKLARAAYAAYRWAQHTEWRTWAPRKGFKNVGAMLRYARRG